MWCSRACQHRQRPEERPARKTHHMQNMPTTLAKDGALMTKKEIVSTGVVAELNGTYWGVQYEDGHSRAYDFGPIENAEISDPQYCKRPRDKTYAGSPYIEKLDRATLVPVRITTTYEVGAIEPSAKPKTYTTAELTNFDTPELNKIREDFGRGLADAVETDAILGLLREVLAADDQNVDTATTLPDDLMDRIRAVVNRRGES